MEHDPSRETTETMLDLELRLRDLEEESGTELELIDPPEFADVPANTFDGMDESEQLVKVYVFGQNASAYALAHQCDQPYAGFWHKALVPKESVTLARRELARSRQRTNAPPERIFLVLAGVFAAAMAAVLSIQEKAKEEHKNVPVAAKKPERQQPKETLDDMTPSRSKVLLKTSLPQGHADK